MSIPAYRLVKLRYASAPFDTEGARREGGRWNSPGTPCVYTAESQSLAMWEKIVHLQDISIFALHALFRISIPEDLMDEPEESSLPADWRLIPHPPSTVTFGDAWLADPKAGLALAVPSVVAPNDRNFILNPHHPSFEEVIAQARPLKFALDPRLEELSHPTPK